MTIQRDNGIGNGSVVTSAAEASAVETVTPIVNQIDKTRLEPQLPAGLVYGPASRLRDLLDRALIVPPEKVPADVVTMNSRIVVRDPAGDVVDTYVLAYPGSESDGALSVLSPLGSALFAAREGERLSYMGAKCLRNVVLEKIEYQPERAGEFDL